MEAASKSSKAAPLKIQTTNLCTKNAETEGAEGNLPSSTRKKKHHSGELFAASRSPPAVAGVLYKWVNYGKGWRPRWFELEDGLLFYYKIHGPDKICINPESLRGFKIIGDEAHKLLKKSKHSSADYRQSRRTFGEVHLKVSAVRESKSDDKKFYIYTGTKTLHLRAEAKEERAAWMEALRTSKELFPKDLTSLSYPPPAESLTVSTKKLREHLLSMGVDEEGIKAAENIMAEEFSRLQQQLQIMQQKRLFLIERLRLLEADKLELETTVVDEMQSHSATGNVVEALKDHVLRLLGADESDSDEDIGEDVVEAESDDEGFYDTRESLSDLYRENSGYKTAVDLLEDERLQPSLSIPDPDASLDRVGFDYPHVERRKKLPEPKEIEKSVSLWSLIKDNIGKDLTRVCLPVYFNEPLSSLQKCFEDLEYSYLLDRAREWGRRGNLLMRALNVAAFAVSGYASTQGRHCKPFNPLLGETYEADYPDKGLRFISEKVSHHPMCIACHCEGQGWVIWADSTLKSKFWGRSIQLDPVGVITLQFDDGEMYQWNKVTSSINNLILGKLYVDHYGTMRIQGNRGLSAKLKFKEQSMIDRNPHQVEGFVHNEAGDKLASLFGKWDESMYYVPEDPRGHQSEAAILLWQKNPPAEFPTRYNLTSFAITLNEITPGLNERLPPNDSRLRPDQRHLENGEFDLANAEKQRLEYKQRQARKVQETGWTPRWFKKVGERYVYTGTYWETRGLGQWDECPDIFGPDIVL